MDKEVRVFDIETKNHIPWENSDIVGVVLGHENCPHFYRQQKVDELIEAALYAGFKVKVNIPVLFEEYLGEFQAEAIRLIEKYKNIKIIANDWGLLYYLHNKYPDAKFVAGKGISFTYGDNPWNEHILFAEKEKYRESLKDHNMENKDTILSLKTLGVDEIEISDLKISEKACENLHRNGFLVTVNKCMSVVTMSRACHCLRFLEKCNEMGSCIQYCTKDISISIQKYYDMMNTELKELSMDTKKMQPDMIVHGNIVMVKNKKVMDNFTYVDNLILDERVLDIGEYLEESY